MNEDAPLLTTKQKDAVRELWEYHTGKNPLKLQDFVNAAYPGETIDPRSKRGALVRLFLADQKIDYRVVREKVPVEVRPLNEDDKEYISNNCPTMKAAEMAEVIYKRTGLTNLHMETRKVIEYIHSLPNSVRVFEDVKDIPDANAYIPPNTLIRCIARVNQYVHEGLNYEKLSGKQKKDLTSLIGYLHTLRFNHQINTYTSKKDRELFESSFIRYTYDKHDLTAEEVDQYVVLATEVIISSSIQAHIRTLEGLLHDKTESEDPRIAMSLVEAISSARKEYNECVKRQEGLLRTLVGKRSERFKNKVSETASLVNLVQLWKDEDTRIELINLADKRRKTVKDEFNRLATMDDLKARIMGITEEEALDG